MNAPSIRTLVAASVLLPALTIAATLVWLGDSTARRLSGDLGDRALDAAADRTRQLVQSYLDDAARVGDEFARRVSRGTLGVADLDAWLEPALGVLATHPRVAAVTFGTADDDAFYIQRTPTGAMETCVARGASPIDRQYVIAADGTRAAEPNRVYDYHPSKRPWFVDATAKPGPRWTPAYTWFSNAATDATTGIGHVQVAAGKDGRPLGVVCVDVTLGELSAYLKSIVPSPASSLYVVDDAGLLIAGSGGGTVLSAGGSRVPLADYADPTAAALGRVAARGQGDATPRTIDVAGVRQWVRISHLSPAAGIDWTVVAATPEDELLGDARRMRMRSILVALVVVAGGAFFALATSRRIARPIIAVNRHVGRVADGDFDARIAVRGARELEELSGRLNVMSADLRDRVELMQSLRLATAVQQSLLPRVAPTFERLDVHGVSDYCDDTGGDYFDFIELVRDPPSDALLLAVGDVMGHGIGSAMLMASARGALRASLLEDVDLAAALDRVNRTLLQSNAGLFMTMTLMRVDAQAGTASWASAGHDAAIVYDPADGSFRELDGAELPLGLMACEYLTHRADGLRGGAILIVGTDGIWETMNAAGEEYGKPRMQAILAANATRDAKAIGAALEADVVAFRGDAPVHDDVTYVIVRFT